MLLTQLRRLGRGREAGFTRVEAGADHQTIDGGVPPAEAEAEVVEGGSPRLRAVPVGPPAPSAFTSFLDGIQRSAVVLRYGPVPIVYAYAAAVVRARRGRRMTTLAGTPSGVASGAPPAAASGLGRTLPPGGAEAAARYHLEREAVFFPFRLVERATVVAAGIPESALVDTGPDAGESPPLFPPALYARAEAAINRWREELELGLAERWCNRGDDPGWLLVDGSLTLSPGLAGCARAVGVIKGHRTRFFDGDDARVLLGLRAGERTSVFRPATRRFTPVYSWYLRLRPPAGRDAFWGLVRIEAAASDATVARADEISRWLLAETAPLSLPDARWDRLLYPIRDCEVYLRARAPAV